MVMNKREVLSRQRKLPTTIPCLVCDGTKIDPEKPTEKCPECNGTGVMNRCLK